MTNHNDNSWSCDRYEVIGNSVIESHPVQGTPTGLSTHSLSDIVENLPDGFTIVDIQDRVGTPESIVIMSRINSGRIEYSVHTFVPLTRLFVGGFYTDTLSLAILNANSRA